MKLSPETKSLITKLCWVFVYIILLVSLCFSGTVLFQKTNYILTYVDGPSMYPTLNNYTDSRYHDCGLVDESETMRQYMERFDIVITYYSTDYTNGVLNSYADKKVKRLIGFPNEHIEIYVENEYNEETDREESIRHLKVNGEDVQLPFDVYDPLYQGSDVVHHKHEVILGENEYFVLGDNWKQSRDSSDPIIGPVTGEMITGILIKTIGYCTINMQTKEIDQIYYTQERYFK